MKVMLCILATFFSLNAFADTPDFSKRFGVSLAGGYDIPLYHTKFDKRADGEFVSGFYGRYQFTRSSGIQFGYTRYEWGHSPTAARLYDVVYMHRMEPRKWFTPIWGAGPKSESLLRVFGRRKFNPRFCSGLSIYRKNARRRA